MTQHLQLLHSAPPSPIDTVPRFVDQDMIIWLFYFTPFSLVNEHCDDIADLDQSNSPVDFHHMNGSQVNTVKRMKLEMI